MRVLLDTCVFAEFTKPTPNRQVIEWVDAQGLESLFVSALTIGEIAKGIAKLPVSKRRKALEEFLEELINRFDRQILALDTEVMRAWGAMTGKLEVKGRKLLVMDSLLAATAIVHDLTVVTLNESDFVPTGVGILNIWRS
jgi:predicted nucleic acid-binding protein